MPRPMDEFIAALGAALVPGIDDAPARAARVLRPWLGRTDFLAGCDCSPRAETYARRLIHADPEGRFCVLSLVWTPGQASPVHAHRAWCALGVHCGELEEGFFALEDGVPVQRATELRGPGACSHAPADPAKIHRIANTGWCQAISVHVYGVGLAAVDTGVNRVYG